MPYRIYGGNIDPHAAVLEIVQQVVWAALIIAGGYALMGYGKSRVVVQGG